MNVAFGTMLWRYRYNRDDSIIKMTTGNSNISVIKIMQRDTAAQAVAHAADDLAHVSRRFGTPNDVNGAGKLNAARLADEATALEKVVDDDTTPRSAKNKSWRA